VLPIHPPTEVFLEPLFIKYLAIDGKMPDVIGLGEAIIDFIALDGPDLSEAASFLKSFGGDFTLRRHT